ncbi:hypothetical protein ACOSQ2_003149 [Xanthoceras sorbifolium]
MGICTIPMSAFVSKSQQRGSPLSLSRSRFSIIIYRSGDNFSFFLCGLRSCSSMLWQWGCRRLIEAEAGATGAICVECADGGETTQMPAQKSKESCRSKWNSSKIHCSIFHALLPKCGETCEGRSGLVGPESHGRGRLSEQLSLQHSVFATTPAGWCIGLTVIGPRGMTLRLERPISRGDTRSVAFPFRKSKRVFCKISPSYGVVSVQLIDPGPFRLSSGRRSSRASSTLGSSSEAMSADEVGELGQSLYRPDLRKRILFSGTKFSFARFDIGRSPTILDLSNSGITEKASLLSPDELASPEALVAAATKLGALASVDRRKMERNRLIKKEGFRLSLIQYGDNPDMTPDSIFFSLTCIATFEGGTDGGQNGGKVTVAQ